MVALLVILIVTLLQPNLIATLMVTLLVTLIVSLAVSLIVSLLVTLIVSLVVTLIISLVVSLIVYKLHSNPSCSSPYSNPCALNPGVHAAWALVQVQILSRCSGWRQAILGPGFLITCIVYYTPKPFCNYQGPVYYPDSSCLGFRA